MLIVDDERAIRRKVARDIQNKDPEVAVYEAENGHEGMEKMEEIRTKYKRDPLFVVLSSTSGETGIPLFKKSVHAAKAHYSPLVTVAKEACINPKKYDATGEKGLVAWMKYFLKAGGEEV